MSTTPSGTPGSSGEADELVAEAVVSRRRGISIVWLVPLVAIIIGGWLVYKAYTERGPIVTIEFEEASGIVAGKTVVRYRNVEVGKVSTVVLKEDLSGIVVTAEMVYGAERFLGPKTQFWIEEPEVSITGVRGLQTLLGGVFIGLDPDTATGRKPQREFVGLDKAPSITDDQLGTFYTLTSPTGGSLNPGSPVLFRGFAVGQVIKHELTEDATRVHTRIFVKAPHDDEIRKNTRFWNASGVDVKLSADGIEVKSKAFVAMLLGGVVFANPEDEPDAEPAASETVFALHDDQESAFRPTYTTRRMLVYFDESVRGLTEGAPVEFRGAKLGEVVDIRAQFHRSKLEFRIPVYVEIQPERFELYGEAAADASEQRTNLQILVDKGLRAQLKTGSLITGQKLVALDMFPDADPVEVRTEEGLLVIPTTPTLLDTVAAKVTGILEKLQRLPLEEISEEMRGAMARIRQMVERADIQPALDALERTLTEAQGFSERLNDDLGPKLSATLGETENLSKRINADITPQIEEMLRELKDAARSIRVMSDYLERHPDALLRGKQSQ